MITQLTSIYYGREKQGCQICNTNSVITNAVRLILLQLIPQINIEVDILDTSDFKEKFQKPMPIVLIKHPLKWFPRLVTENTTRDTQDDLNIDLRSTN